jgi:CHAP domain
MAGTATDVLQAAMSQLSYRGKGTCGNPSSKFGRWYGVDPVQWCDCFVSWCLVQGGVDPVGRSGRHGGEAFVPTHLNNFKKLNRFHSEAEPGDVVFFKWPGESNFTADHIGLVHQVRGDGSVISVEGNTAVNEDGFRCGNACGTNNYDPVTIVGFGRPDYRASSMSLLSGPVFIEPILEEIMTWYDSKKDFEKALTQIVRQEIAKTQIGRDGKPHGVATLVAQELRPYFLDASKKHVHRMGVYVDSVVRRLEQVKGEILAAGTPPHQP